MKLKTEVEKTVRDIRRSTPTDIARSVSRTTDHQQLTKGRNVVGGTTPSETSLFKSRETASNRQFLLTRACSPRTPPMT